MLVFYIFFYIYFKKAKEKRGGGVGRGFTLQKSMLLTPLLPKAGPTGGLGLAWPAPTISFTIKSLGSAFEAILVKKY